MEDKITLFGLREQYVELMLLAQDPDADAELIADTMEGIEGEITEKVDGYAAVIRNLESRAEMYKKEAKRLGDIARHIENGIERMKARIKETMEAMDVTVLEGTYTTAKIQKNGGQPALKYVEGAQVPEKYTKITIEPDGKAIRQAIKDGEKIDFAYLETPGTHLRLV